MFLSESMMRAIHADRVREIERSNRERRLVDEAAEAVAADVQERAVRSSNRASVAAARPGRTGIAA